MSVKLGVDPQRFDELRAQSQRCLIQFLEVEVQLGFTFVDAAAYQRDLGQANTRSRPSERLGKRWPLFSIFLGASTAPKFAMRSRIAACNLIVRWLPSKLLPPRLLPPKMPLTIQSLWRFIRWPAVLAATKLMNVRFVS